jgi:NADP-dependent 3-hydroxy acid dehydrogenase YdfG
MNQNFPAIQIASLHIVLSWDAVIKEVLAKYRTVDYLFNNAGVMMRPKPNIKLTMNDWHWVIDTNVWGALYGLRKFTGIMMGQEKGGHIITTASTATVAPFSMWAPYTVSKAAVSRVVECFQSEASLMKMDKVKYHISYPGVFESDVSNGAVYRNDKYKNEGEVLELEPVSKAGTLEGDKLGKITAEETAQMILEQMEEGKFYIYTHEDLTHALIKAEAEAMLENKPVVDQVVFDFAFYAKKLEAQGIDVGGASNLQKMGQKEV